MRSLCVMSRHICEVCLVFVKSDNEFKPAHPWSCSVYAFYRGKESMYESRLPNSFELYNKDYDNSPTERRGRWTARLCMNCRQLLNACCPDPIPLEMESIYLDKLEAKSRYFLNRALRHLPRYSGASYRESDLVHAARRFYGGDAGIRAMKSAREG
jgi:hypothetical protein